MNTLAEENYLKAIYKLSLHDKSVSTNQIAAALDTKASSVTDMVRKLAEKTLVIFSSDNGPHKEGGHFPNFFDSNGPLRGIKRDVYEGGVRVPFIAHWPGKVAAGSTSERAANSDTPARMSCARMAGRLRPMRSTRSFVTQLPRKGRPS